MKNRKFLSPFLAIVILVGVLLLDLLTKEFIIKGLIPNLGDRVDVIPNVIDFIHVKNFGAAWGMLAGRPVFLIVISILVIGFLIAYYIIRVKKTGKNSSCLFGIAMGLIAGGCFGNLVDRFAFGYVRDFINFQFIKFPVFNFADVALTFGVIILLIYFIFYYSKEDKKLAKDKIAKDFQEEISFSSINDLTAVSEELKENSADNEDKEKNIPNNNGGEYEG